MFLAIFSGEPDGSYDTVTIIGKGSSLKSAYEALKDQASDQDIEHLDEDEVEFFEAEKIAVEFQIVRKEVVTSVPKAAPAVKAAPPVKVGPKPKR